MSRIIKMILVLLAALVGVMAVAAVALVLFFDPNDYKEEISAGVLDATGRELVIDGDLSLSVFPWLAIEVGSAELGNAENFSEQPFLSFANASLSVKMLPLILRQDITVGTASIDGLVVNLEVANDGRNNWDDLSQDDSPGDETDSGEPTELELSGISVTKAMISYTDAAAGASYALSNLNIDTGSIATNDPIDLTAEFDFAAMPDDLKGHLAIRGTAMMNDGGAQLTVDGLNIAGEVSGLTAQPADFNFDSRQMNIDTVAQSAALGEMDLTVFGLALSVNVEPFSYAGTPQPKAQLRVAEFSLRELMQALDIDPPATADPNALSRVSIEAIATVGAEDISLTDLSLQLDDSTMSGGLTLPMSADGSLGFDLVVDAINLDAYMAPAEDGIAAGADADEGDVEIPVDMIRTLNAQGNFRIERAMLSGLEFTNMQMGLQSADGRLRLNPLTAELYDGNYRGDVRIDASGDLPTIAVNERIAGVNLASLAKSMFDQDNISGQINGSFVLSGSGQNVAAIRQDLDGNMTLELVDGAWEGTDLWYEMRSARAKYKQQPAPEATLPARTEFTTVSASGIVTDGIFANDDLMVELPFLQVTGNGIVDLNAAQINYSMQARVLDKPEFMDGVTAAELEDFTEVVIPLKVSGALSAPSITPDIEAIFRQQVEEAIEEKTDELKNKLLERLLGGDEETEGTDEQPAEEDPEKDLQRKLLEKLIGN